MLNPMKKLALIITLFLCSFITVAQNDSVDIDGRVQPYLQDFLDYCDLYGINYEDKLFQLKSIKIVNDLPLEEHNTILGKVLRDENGKIDRIVFNWATLLDKEILQVVAFHEFAHHFLDYKHTCRDCNEIMAETNVSYFDIIRDWDNQVEQLFTTSPVYLSEHPEVAVAQHKPKKPTKSKGFRP